MLFHRIEIERVRLRTELRGCQFILYLHHRFISLDKRQQFAALRVLKTLLVQHPIEVGQQVMYLPQVVFQGNREAASMGLIRQPRIVVQLIVVGEWETGVVGVAVHVKV